MRLIALQDAAHGAEQAGHGGISAQVADTLAHGADATAHAVSHFEPTLLWLIPLLPLLGFVLNALVAFRTRPRTVASHGHDAHGHDAHGLDAHGHEAHAHAARPSSLPSIIGPSVMAVAFALALINFLAMLGAELHEPVIETYFSWLPVGDFQVDAAFQLDQLSMLMTLIITGVGFLIHVFSVGYMKEDAGYARYFAYLNLFVFFMLILVLGSSFALMFVGWEGVGLCSYLLIGFWFRDNANADAGKKAFIVNRIGDFGFLVAMFMIFAHVGSLDFVDVFAAAPGTFPYAGAAVTAITLFMFLGATGKSAQIPLYTWLPDAMAGPTPVSALIHAATMVTAGVYMVARSSVLFALAPTTMIVVAGIGATTALFAATIGLRQYDIKKVLAYSTVSQLGYMFIGVGVGAYAAGVFHLMTHAFFKALLFLGSGAVIHAMHHALHHTHSEWDAQDMRNMGGLRKYMPITFTCMWIATLAISGVWPFAGFFSKDEIIWQAAARAVGPFAGWFTLFWVMALVAAMLTAFYMTRLMIMTFHGDSRLNDAEKHHLHEVSPVMWLPLVVLAIASIVGGWINVPHAIEETILGIVPSSEWLHEWLHPVTAGAEAVFAQQGIALNENAPVGGGEAIWAAISLAIATAVVALSAFFLLRRPVRNALEAPADRGFARVLYRKWYVDEIYDLFIVKPLVGASKFAWLVIDAAIIDGLFVNGSGYASKALGWMGARLQTGSLGTYALALVVGVVAIVLVVVL